MRESEYLQCLHFNCFVGDKKSNQSIPIVLPIDNQDRARLEGCQALALTREGQILAVLRRPEIFAHRKEERCARTFGTTHPEHPMIKVSDDEPFFKSNSSLGGFEMPSLDIAVGEKP